MNDELVSRKAVMDELVKEYNRRYDAGDRGGLKLAWIEKAVNSAPCVNQWTPVTRLPELDHEGYSEKLLLSFSNFGLPTIGEYRVANGDGHWYDGDDDKPLEDYGLKVNAWMKLPEMYKEEEE